MNPRSVLTAVAAGCAVSLGAQSASGAFVQFVTVVTPVTTGGVLLDQVKVYARFNGPTDTVVNVFNFAYQGCATVADPYGAFWHKDNSDYNGGVLSKQYGTWAPSLTGSATLNRPFDSFLCIGGTATATNTSNADPSWNSGGTPPHAGSPGLSWNRSDIPNNSTLGWYNASLANRQGQVAIGPNTATDVLLGQFILDRSASAGTWTLSIGYNNGTPGASIQFVTSDFLIGSTSAPFNYYRDLDGDGIGYAADGAYAGCSPPPGYVPADGDNCPGIANPDQADCNANLIGDACDLANGYSADCDSDGIPNECEGAVRVTRSSPIVHIQSASGSGTIYAFTELPRVFGRAPILRVDAIADLGNPDDGITVNLNNEPQGVRLFELDGNDCPSHPDRSSVTLNGAQASAISSSGTLLVRLSPFGSVDSQSCASGGVRLWLDYDTVPADQDCNSNGALDSCEIGTGAAPDCNANGRLDACELAAGQATDCNGNGRLDICDLATGTSTDLNLNGVLDDCAGEYVVGGSGFGSIQAAILAVPAGTTIQVSAGSYGPIDLSGKSITVESIDGPLVTFLDGGGIQRCVDMTAPANGATVLSGFTIRNGFAEQGAGVRVTAGSLALRNSVLRSNIASDAGGGVAAINAAMTIVDCLFLDNSAQRGGGLFIERLSGAPNVIVRKLPTSAAGACAFISNQSLLTGGAIHNRGRLVLDGVVVQQNDAAAGGGGLWTLDGSGISSVLGSCTLCMNVPENTVGPWSVLEESGANQLGRDCNENGQCDLFEVLADCDADGEPDACELLDGVEADCNANGIPDGCDLATGDSADIDANGVPDECKPDCDGDGLPDAWELSTGIEVDCNENGLLDRCDITTSPALDCDGNGRLDVCEVVESPALDCDTDQKLDVCEIAGDPALDDDLDGRLDACERRLGDFDLNGSIGGGDLAYMLSYWGVSGVVPADLDGDGAVAGGDLAILLGRWGPLP